MQCVKKWVSLWVNVAENWEFRILFTERLECWIEGEKFRYIRHWKTVTDGQKLLMCETFAYPLNTQVSAPVRKHSIIGPLIAALQGSSI